MLAELLEDPEVQAEFNARSEHDRIAYIAHAKWVASAHRYQVPPPLEQDYTVWMMLAGTWSREDTLRGGGSLVVGVDKPQLTLPRPRAHIQ